MDGLSFIIGLKVCNSCSLEKSNDQFEKNRNKCKECRRVENRKKYHLSGNKQKILNKNKQRYQSKKEEILKKHKEYNRDNKEKIRQKLSLYKEKHKNEINLYQQKYRQNNKEILRKQKKEYNESAKGRYNSYCARAKKIKIFFTLTLKDFEEITSKKCFYCGNFSKEKKYSGIDRIKNDIGYTKENCISCCGECNYVKNDSTFEQIERIYLGMQKLACAL